jgi:hypothetical protein
VAYFNFSLSWSIFAKVVPSMGVDANSKVISKYVLYEDTINRVEPNGRYDNNNFEQEGKKENEPRIDEKPRNHNSEA